MRGNIGPSKKNTRREAAAMALVFVASTAGMLTMMIEKITAPRNDIRRSSRGAMITVSPANKKRPNVKSDWEIKLKLSEEMNEAGSSVVMERKNPGTKMVIPS